MEIRRFLKMDERDMVATALVDLKAGEEAVIFFPDNTKAGQINAREDIPYGNKIALADILKGDKVIKYGAEIGEATATIHKGDLVHVHNVRSLMVDIPVSIKNEIMRQMNIQQREEGVI